MKKYFENLMHLNLLNTKIKFTIICFICLWNILLFAQESTLSTLPIVQTEQNVPTSSTNNIRNEDFERILKIYIKLVNARGDFRYPVPKLFLRKEVSRVASIDYNKLEIVIEEKAYKACLQYGDAAIAFLLGHELTHYYEKHAWRNNFAYAYSDLQIGQEMEKFHDQTANETEADYLGGFLAYSAGYGMFEKADSIIIQLYKEYKLSDQLKGYPSLQDRIELAKRSTKKIAALVEVFEMANLLSAIGKYEEAAEYYTFILMQFQSREIFNNLGVVALQNALQYFDSKELKFKYVFELELESMGSRDANSKKAREALLQQSIRHFDAAISMDINYAPAYLNKAAALALLGDTIRASFFVEQEALLKAQQNKFAKTAVDANILLGILKSNAGDTNRAVALFESAIRVGSKLAKDNLNILRFGKIDSIVVKRNLSKEFISIQKQNLNSFSSEPVFNSEKVIKLNPKYTLYQFYEDSLDYTILFNMNNDSRDINYFMMTKPTCKVQTNKKIGIGSNLSELEMQYGNPQKMIETVQGSILIYDKLIFILGKENEVIKWGTFLTKKSMD
ncbi:MAG: hypothetical protein IPO16_12180 [Saprospiraceae bacterium]|nr:hypothetical protein [Saprospiraceae bacterium]